MALGVLSSDDIAVVPANPYVAGLMQGGGWRWTSNTIHWDAPASDVYTGARVPLLANATRDALNVWASVANITVQRATKAAGAEIVTHLTDSGVTPGLNGVSGGPVQAAQSGNSFDGSVLIAEFGRAHTYVSLSDGFFNLNSASEPTSVTTRGFGTLLHELGHALGLKHPHDRGAANNPVLFPGVDGTAADGSTVPFPDDLGDNGLNKRVYTIMSYNRDAIDLGLSTGLGAFDVAAIQQLYGARTNVAGGDNNYLLRDVKDPLGKPEAWDGAIWDTGGTDAIVYNGSANAVIDLRPATLDNSSTGGGALSYIFGVDGFARGFTIAGDVLNAIADREGVTGVIIENARGGFGSDTLTGNGVGNVLDGQARNDVLYGLAGNDTLKGGNGADSMYGGAGNDTYEVFDAGDVVYEELYQIGGIDTINTILSTYTLGSDPASIIENLRSVAATAFTGIGNGVNNRIDSAGGRDRLEGRDGNDTLNGGANADTLVGGIGDDTYYVNGADVLLEEADPSINGVDTVLALVPYFRLGPNVENLTNIGSIITPFYGYGNALDNVLTGSGGADYLYGFFGSDTLSGGGGTNGLIGGDGDDTFLVNTIYDSVIESRGTSVPSEGGLSYDGGIDTVRVGRLASYALTGFVENLVYTGSYLGTATFTGIGNAEDNRLTGGNVIDKGDVLLGWAGADTLQGLNGNDTLTGGAGIDRLEGGNGNDTYYVDDAGDVVVEDDGEQGGRDTVYSTLATYTLADNVENLIVYNVKLPSYTGIGNALDNVITARSSYSFFFHTLNGLGGADTLNGSTSNDGTFGKGDILDGGDGADSVAGLGNHDTLAGGSGHDTLDGGIGNDSIDALGYADLVGADSDVIRGGAGNDTIAMGAYDVVDGGAGIDTASFAANGQAVFVDLHFGAAWIGIVHGTNSQDGTISGIEKLVGSAFDDTFLVAGDTAAGGVMGPNGFEGGEGEDLVSYFRSRAAVAVDLLNPAQNRGDARDDTFSGIEDLGGTTFADTLRGNDGDNVLMGYDGADSLDGRGGSDTASYLWARAAVTADLANPANNLGEAAGDRYASIENLDGGVYADSLRGDGGANRLSGEYGDDTLQGGGGNDTLSGGDGLSRLEDGNDVFVFGYMDVGRAADVITDFGDANGNQDIIQFDSIVYASFSQLMASGNMSQVGADVVIEGGSADKVTLLGVQIGNLGADDFRFV